MAKPVHVSLNSAFPEAFRYHQIENTSLAKKIAEQFTDTKVCVQAEDEQPSGLPDRTGEGRARRQPQHHHRRRSDQEAIQGRQTADLDRAGIKLPTIPKSASQKSIVRSL